MIQESSFPHPNSRGEVYSSRRILALVAAGLEATLTLLCAPPGYGKTTALRLALGACGRRVCWMQLTGEDNDPKAFFHHLGLVNNTVQAEDRVSRWRATDLSQLVFRHLAAQAGETCLVLDDYDVIQSKLIHDLVSQLIAYRPNGLHLFISTRSEPPFALSKLRLHGELVELHAAQLALTEEETAAMLRLKMGRAPTPADVRAVWRQSEGWPAMTCLLAQSLDGEPRPRQPINHRQAIYQYVEEEIYSRQSPTQRDFLLRTSVLKQLTLPVCEAILEQPNARTSFGSLIRSQVLLPAEGEVYRYHPMLADFLKQKLLEQKPALVGVLHRRAAGWYEHHGEPRQALEHEMEAGDSDGALERVSRLGWEALQKGDHETVLRWCARMESISHRPLPELAEIKGFALLLRGDVDDAERTLSGLSTVRAVLASAMIARYHGSYAAVEQVAAEALSRTPAVDNGLRCQIELQLGLARLYDRKVTEAEQVLSQALYHAEQTGDVNLVLAVTNALSVVYHNRGEYDRSIPMLERSLAIGGAELTAEILGTRLRLAQLLLETGRIDPARFMLDESLRTGMGIVSAEILAYGYIVRARIARLEGNLTRAAEYHQIAARLAPRGGLMHKANLTERMLLYLASNETTVVESWAAEVGLAPENADYTGDECYLVLGRLRLRQYQADAAVQVLEKVLHHARQNNWGHAQLLVLPWLATARLQAGCPTQAAATFCEALRLSSPHGYCLAFLEAYQEFPQVLRSLMNTAQKQGCDTRYVTNKLAEVHGSAPLEAPTVITPHMPPADCFEVRVFGGLRVFRGGLELAEKGWRTERARDLLAYLAVHYSTPTPIDTLIEQLWPDRPLSETRRLFHTNLYYLRRTLLPNGEDLDLFSRRSGCYVLNPRHFWIDAKVFDDLTGSQADSSHLATALQLAKDPCLMGYYGNWAVEAQRVYDQRVIRVLEQLARQYAEAGSLAEAVSCVEKALSMDPLNEGLARQLMKWHRLLGNRTAAVQCFETLRQNLAKELSIDPSGETMALANQMRL